MKGMLAMVTQSYRFLKHKLEFNSGFHGMDGLATHEIQVTQTHIKYCVWAVRIGSGYKEFQSSQTHN